MTGKHEKPLLEILRQLAAAHGWLFYHTYDSRRSEPGFPDVIIIRDNHLIAIELKRDEHDQPTDAQWAWLRAFADVRVAEAWVLRPSSTLEDLEGALR